MRCQFIHDLSETRADVPEQQAPIDTKMTGSLKPTATSFVPKAQTTNDSALKVEAQEFKFVPVKKVQEPVAEIKKEPVTAPTFTGGFGNKQTANGLVLHKVIYREILVHSIKVSIQEFQKKMKMFNKKVTKPKQKMVMDAPDLQYMNIYSGSVPRLSCFKEMTSEFYPEDQEEALFHGDATAYEHHLDEELLKFSQGHYDDYIPYEIDQQSIQSQHMLIQQLS